MRLRRWPVLGVSAIVVFLIVVLIVRSGRREETRLPSAESGPAVRVKTLTVRMEAVPSFVELPGTVEPYAEAQLAPKIMSTVHRVYVREGDYVRKGQALVVLEHRDLAAGVVQAKAGVRAAEAARRQAGEAARIQDVTGVARVKQAEAQLGAARAAARQAEANLDLVREGSRKQQKAQAAQAVEQAKAQYELAKVSYERMQRLYEGDVIARQQLDEAKAKHDVALASLNSAKQQQSIVEEGARAQEEIVAEQAVRQARSQLEVAQENLKASRAALGETAIRREQVRLAAAQAEQARAGLTQAEVQRGYAVIRAPFGGVITQKNVDPGTMVAPGSLLLVVQDAQRFRLSATAPEEKAALVVQGVPARVKIDTAPGREFATTIDTVVPAADPQSRTFVVKASLPAAPGVRSGAFGRLVIAGGRTPGLYVPTKALWRSGQLTGVFVVGRDRVARLRLVTTGRTVGARTEILSGLSDGDVIAANNLSRIRDGGKVDPTADAAVKRVSAEERP